MPLVEITIMEGRTREQKRAMMAEVTDAIVREASSRIELPAPPPQVRNASGSVTANSVWVIQP